MAHPYRSIVVCMAAASLGVACIESETSDLTDSVGLATAALSICDEAVPANRNIDGIPAYAQCAASENSAIYSNNGVDTSTTQMGSDWVRTQWSGGYQCTELANRYLRFRWGVKWIPNGNAGNWCDTQPPASSGMVQTMTPVHGDLMVLAPGSCGAAQGTGHVTVVDEVNDTKLVVVEQNGARRGTYNLSCAKCFLHVMANDGVPMPASGIPTSDGTAGAAAPAPTTPAQGAGGSPATPTDNPRRPRGPGAAGGAAPGATPAPAAGGSAAPVIPPAATPPVTPAPAATPTTTTSPATGTLVGGVAAGSSAPAPLVGAVTTPSTGTREAVPEAGGCSVGAVGSAPSPRGLGLMLAFGMIGLSLRRSRRRT